jgi:DNA-binding transcriptional ArsR family regulator
MAKAKINQNKHEELIQYLPPEEEPTKRKMLSCTPETHDKVNKLAREMGVSMTKVLSTLVAYYEDAE